MRKTRSYGKIIGLCLAIVIVSGCQNEKSMELEVEFLGLSGQNVYSITSDRENPELVFAVTLTVEYPSYAEYSDIYRTADHGKTWQKLQDPIFPFRSSIWFPTWNIGLVIHPLNPEVLLLRTFRGIYQSKDKGDSWTKLCDGLFGSLTPQIEQPGVFYAGFSKNDDGVVAKSIDSGRTWNTLKQVKWYVNKAIVSETLLLSGSAPFPDSIYAVFYNLDDENHVGTRYYFIFSDDGGMNWRDKIDVTGFDNLTVDPSTGRLLALNQGELYASLDQGNTWKKIVSGLPVAANCLALNPNDPKDIYLGTSGGVYRSLDGGTSWNLLALDGRMVNAIHFSSFGSGKIYVGTDDGFWLLNWVNVS